MNNKLNLHRFTEYREIFGLEKMRRLWCEFQAVSEPNWQKLETEGHEEQRRVFHNWRSSSLVFGMEEFSHLCTIIEECILKRHFSQTAELISQSKLCYDQSIKEVEAVFNQWEHADEK